LRDVFGLVLLHAMAESLPIVASREGTIPEILPDESHGLLFEKGNARALANQVLVLAQDESRRHNMGEANRKRFEKFYSLKRYGSEMTRAFEDLNKKTDKVS
jgi:glycosyltransferase involved in cell wall biosynthesis